jgi:predicted PurR-regulated permease PerM
MDVWRELLPRNVRTDIVSLARQVDEVLSHFVVGQLTVMAIMGGLYAIGYTLIGARLAVPVGLLAGFLTFVSYVGSTVAPVLCLLMLLVHFTGWGQIIAVASTAPPGPGAEGPNHVGRLRLRRGRRDRVRFGSTL